MEKNVYTIIKYFSVISILIGLVIIITFSILKFKTEWTASDISEKIKDKMPTIYRSKIINNLTNDFKSKSELYDKNIDGASVTITVFENLQDAKVEYNFLEWKNDEFFKIVKEEDFGSYFEKIKLTKTINYLDNNVVLSINSNYSNEDVQKILETFKKTLKKYIQKEINVSSDKTYIENKVEELKKNQIKIWNNYRTQLENKLHKIEEKINDCNETQLINLKEDLAQYSEIPIINELYKNILSKIEMSLNEFENEKKEYANNITSKLKELLKTLNKEELETTKNEINNLSDSYYDNYINEWNDLIEKINEKLELQKINDYKNNCKNLSYKNVLRNPDNYLYEKAYWFGVVYQDVGYGNYRVGIDCTKYRYSSGYSCDNTIYVTYYGDEKLIEDDVVKMWGYMNGTVTYTTVLGAYMTIPSFVAEYITLQ